MKSTKASQPVSIGCGFKLVTPDVEDVLATDAAVLGIENMTKLILSSTCILENLPAYRLDPPRGGAQQALVTITGQVDDVFVVEHVQLLTPEEATAAKTSLLKLLQVAVEIKSRDNYKRVSTWTEN